MKRIYNLIILLGLVVIAPAAKAQSKSGTEITRLMDEAAASWNKGDLDAYMSLYDPAATMMLKDGRAGIDSIRAVYVKYYFNAGRPKQELAYNTYQLTMLGEEYALLTGRFILKANDKYKERTGIFSLIFVRRHNGWKLLHDHSG